MKLGRLQPSLPVRDLKETLAFYLSRLGLTQTAAYPGDGPATKWCDCLVGRGRARLHRSAALQRTADRHA